MKKYFPIIVGVFGAILSAALIYFRKDIGDTGTVKAFAQVIMPVLLAIVFAFLSGTMKKKLVRLGIMLGSFFVILSVLSPFAFKYWVSQTTPAGSVYSRYDMDALYPWFGLIIVIATWLTVFILVLVQDILRRAMHLRAK